VAEGGSEHQSVELGKSLVEREMKKYRLSLKGLGGDGEAVGGGSGTGVAPASRTSTPRWVRESFRPGNGGASWRRPVSQEPAGIAHCPGREASVGASQARWSRSGLGE